MSRLLVNGFVVIIVLQRQVMSATLPIDDVINVAVMMVSPVPVPNPVTVDISVAATGSYRRCVSDEPSRRAITTLTAAIGVVLVGVLVVMMMVVC